MLEKILDERQENKTKLEDKYKVIIEEEKQSNKLKIETAWY
jgi:hypothetical protein